VEEGVVVRAAEWEGEGGGGGGYGGGGGVGDVGLYVLDEVSHLEGRE
jgi:hypothetical protein